MWKLKDSSNIIGTHIKVESYKNHLSNLKNIKPRISVASPWKPSFSLSKRKNKYHKVVEQKIEKENRALLVRMLEIEGKPMTETYVHIPMTIPSNRISYAEFKERERRSTNLWLDKENQKILSKIEGVSSGYGKQVWEQDWKQTERYRDNIIKKCRAFYNSEYVPDYRALAKEEENLFKERKRPFTASARN